MTTPAGARRASARSAHRTPSFAQALVRDGRPLYQQLAEDLRRRILREEFKVGRSIPTEAQLSRDYRASRITVRHALDLLEQEGLLYREQGRGSFIRPRAIAVGPRRLTSFSEELRERGRTGSSDLLAVDTLDDVGEMPLDLNPNEGCVRIERVRRADDQAIAHQITYIPAEFGVDIEASLRRDGSLYDYLRTRHALDIDSADETYRVGSADRVAAESWESSWVLRCSSSSVSVSPALAGSSGRSRPWSVKATRSTSTCGAEFAHRPA